MSICKKKESQLAETQENQEQNPRMFRYKNLVIFDNNALAQEKTTGLNKNLTTNVNNEK